MNLSIFNDSFPLNVYVLGEVMSAVINIVGAGRLGKTIAKLINIYDAGSIQAVCNKSLESTRDAITFIGSGNAYSDIKELPHADITFITTPDDHIHEVAEALALNQNYESDAIFIHCSGSLTSSVLAPLSNVASCHPMRSFARPDLSVAEFKGTYCAIEGTTKAATKASELFRAIGGQTYEICADKKSLYHAAGVISSNYLVTLAHTASQCLSEAGVDDEIGMRIITNLMAGTVKNMQNTLSPQASLTGPIARGDTETVTKHIQCMDGEMKTLYKMLGLTTLELTSLPASQRAALEDTLSSTEESNEAEIASPRPWI